MNRRQALELLLVAAGDAILPEPFVLGQGTAILPNTGENSFPSSAAIPAAGEHPIAPAFTWLMLGEVKPAGWIKEQMLRDLHQGFAGCLDKLCPQASSDAFVTHRNTIQYRNTGVTSPGLEAASDWWNGETEGNWRAGFIMMSYLSDDPTFMQQADEYVRHILGSQDSDGYLGVFGPKLRFTQQGELWTQACLLRGLLDYAEATGSRDTMRAIVRCADLTIQVYGNGRTAFPWGQNHDLMICDVMERLFQLTGDGKYRDFSLWFYRAWSRNAVHADCTLPLLLNREIGFEQHGVTTYENMRVPLWLWMATGQQDLGQAARNAFYKLSRYTEVGGSAVSEENVNNLAPDPTYTEYEYCSSKEIQFTLESNLQKTGQAAVADKIERLWFNAAQGSRTPDGRAITYLTPDNRTRCEGRTPDGSNLEPRNKFSPTHKDVAVCCNPNATNVAPLYVRGMWMRHRRNGLAALLYGPCTVSTKVGGTRVNLNEKTNYPFENTVEIEVRPESEIEFPLLLRNPEWSRGTRVGCPGANIARKGEYWVVTKKWRAGDTVQIRFAPRIQQIAAVNGEIALQYGALVFAKPHEARTISVEKYRVSGFEDFFLVPAPETGETLAFPADSQWEEFGFEAVQLAKGTRPSIPFDRPTVALEGSMIQTSDGAKVPVQLIPLGNAWGLRRLTFPLVS